MRISLLSRDQIPVASFVSFPIPSFSPGYRDPGSCVHTGCLPLTAGLLGVCGTFLLLCVHMLQL